MGLAIIKYRVIGKLSGDSKDIEIYDNVEIQQSNGIVKVYSPGIVTSLSHDLCIQKSSLYEYTFYSVEEKEFNVYMNVNTDYGADFKLSNYKLLSLDNCNFRDRMIHNSVIIKLPTLRHIKCVEHYVNILLKYMY